MDETGEVSDNMWITQESDRYIVDTGVLKIDVPKSGSKILENGIYNERKIIEDASLVYVNENIEDEGLAQKTKQIPANGYIMSACIDAENLSVLLNLKESIILMIRCLITVNLQEYHL